MNQLLLAALLALPAAAVQVQGPAVPGAQSPAQAGPGLNFSHTPQTLGAAYAQAKTRYEQALSGVVAVPAGQRTFANTVKALEEAGAVFSESTYHLTFLAYTSADKGVREAAQEVEQDSGRFGVEIWSRDALYQAVKAYADLGETLTGEDEKLLKETLRAFKMSGHGLPQAQKDRLKEVQQKLSDLSTRFEYNINDENGGMNLTLAQLQGLPADFVARLKVNDDGTRRVTLKDPDYVPFMKYADDAALRRQMQFLYKTRATPANLPLMSEGIRLRDEQAKLLGYETYADLALEPRMAGTQQKVWDFLNNLLPILRVQGEKELSELLAIKRRDDPNAQRLEAWDLNYYAEKLRRERYQYDSEEVKKYFPVEKVVEGTMGVYEELLGVKFDEVKNPGAQIWHPEVRLFQVKDTATGALIGHLYLDLYPREGKYSHAAAFPLLQGRELFDGSYRMPAAAMVANLATPSPGQPALLPLRDVETFFHEFGHNMHQILTKAKYTSFSGANVALDFVEAPSQMLENFVWQREVLDRISGHYANPSQKLPDDLFEKMKAARGFNKGLQYLTQVAYAMIDLTYNTAVPQNTSRLFNQMMEVIGLLPVQPGTSQEAAFGHLMSGYASGYYSYLWSEVFADDIFSRFEENGVMNPATGMAWRREVLEKGASRPEMESLRRFLGREPSSKAFMDRMSGEAEKRRSLKLEQKKATD